jgi:LPXTG-motif cell wall-anchored protein
VRRALYAAAVGLLIAGTTTFGLASPAGAATTVTASPSSGLTGGDLMTLSGGGFPHGKTVTVYECVGTYQPAPGSKLDATQCDMTPMDTVQAQVAPDGTVSTWMFFQSPLFTSSTPSGWDCANGCSVVADPQPNVDAMTIVHGDNACRGNAGSVGVSTKQLTLEGHTYSSDPGGLTAKPGDVVSVTIGWDPSIFTGTPDQAWDCVYFGQPPNLGGTDLGQPFDTFEKPASMEPFTTSFTVQSSWSGQTVCDRGRVSGQATGGLDGGQKSNQFCFDVLPGAQLAEFPWPPLVGGAALLTGAAFFLIRRRKMHGLGSATP